MESIDTWKQYLRDRGISDSLVSQYLRYINDLNNKSLPVIFEVEHLSKILNIDHLGFVKIINSPESFYRSFKIRKAKGGYRNIVAPYPSLQSCQRWIYKNILLKLDVHSSAHGFVKGRSIFSNASLHLNQKALLKLDLKDFFPSIPINWVISLFSSLGYPHNISFYLASLCCYEGALSQGAVTSPYISNVLLRSLDKRLKSLASKYELNYSRYADDMTFSGAYIPHKFIDIVDAVITDFGLRLNEEKNRLHTKPGKRIVTGLSVSGDELRLPRAYKRKLKQEVFYIRKYGLVSHISKMKIKHPYYLESLIGKLNFLSQAEPGNEFASDSLTYLKELKKNLESND